MTSANPADFEEWTEETQSEQALHSLGRAGSLQTMPIDQMHCNQLLYSLCSLFEISIANQIHRVL